MLETPKTDLKRAKIVLVNPNLVLQKNDVFTTGVVYMPVGLAYFTAALRAANAQCQVVDAFGENPTQCWEEGKFLFRGITPDEVVRLLEPETSVVVLYAINLTYHASLTRIIRSVRTAFPKITIIVMENTQAVTAYSLKEIQQEFYDIGVDYLLTGEAEERGIELIERLLAGDGDLQGRGLDGIGFRRQGKTHYSAPAHKIADLDSLPFPAWDLFPLEKYWALKYAHGPLTGKKYLPLLTSRGCPYQCRFCVIPATNNLKWRSRSARHVVDEIEFSMKKFGVTEFHIEDVDPTVNDKRTQKICREIIKRKLKITWKICAGTKIETIRSAETIQLMAQSGCRYVSISPESGSPRIMKLIGKPFNYEHAIKMIGEMSAAGIHTQACFVLGFPGEEDADRELTRKMVRDLTIKGVDEVAIFIVTPVPGSAIQNEFKKNYKDYSELNFSPTWRTDYEVLSRSRLTLYRTFFFWKALRHPLKLAKQPFSFLSRRFETKMEMVPYRALMTVLMNRNIAGKCIQYRPQDRVVHE